MADSPLSRETTLHIARLARLRLADEEVERMRSELEKIIDYVRLLDEVDTSSVEPTAHVSLDRLPMRDDVVVEGVSHDDALAQAPRAIEGGFGVPTFVDE